MYFIGCMVERTGPMVENETTPAQPLLEWEGISEEGEGKFVFNGPGLLRHAEEKGLQLPEEIISTLRKVTWNIVTEAEEILSLDEIDQEFIVSIGDLVRDDLEKEGTL